MSGRGTERQEVAGGLVEERALASILAACRGLREEGGVARLGQQLGALRVAG